MRRTRLLVGRWVLGSLLVLGAGACRAEESSTTSARPSATPATTPVSLRASTTRDDVAETRRFSRWLLHALPLPPGAREWNRSPTPHYRHGSIGIGPSDPRFTRTTWWTVSGSGRALDSWLRSHVPHGLRADSADGGAVESGGVWEHDQDFHAPGTAAHTEGWVNVAFMPHGAGLVVRVDTFAGARFARTVLVPVDATAVTIRRTDRHPGPRGRSRTSVRTVTDRRSVDGLVAMFDDLPGAMTSPFVASCRPVVQEQSYSMTFATPHGSYAGTLPTTACWPRLTVTLDGVGAGPPLDPGRAFARTADSYLR